MRGLPAAPTTFIQSRGAFGRPLLTDRRGARARDRLGAGDPGPRPSPTPDWGLHLVDSNIAQDDLVKVARRQFRAHGRR